MIIRQITVIMITANASIAFLRAAGINAVYGVTPATGIGSEAARAVESAREVGSGPLGLLDALGGATVAAIDALSGLFSLVFAAPTLALNLGIPEFIVAFVFAPLYVVVAIDVVAILRGDSGI